MPAAVAQSSSAEPLVAYPPRFRWLIRLALASIALARQARSHPHVDWGIPLTRPSFSILLPSLNTSRNLANLLADAALHAHLHGDDAEAVERLRDLHYLARAVDRQPFLISHLVSV